MGHLSGDPQRGRSMRAPPPHGRAPTTFALVRALSHVVGVTGFEPAASSSRSTLTCLGRWLLNTKPVHASARPTTGYHRNCYSDSHSRRGPEGSPGSALPPCPKSGSLVAVDSPVRGSGKGPAHLRRHIIETGADCFRPRARPGAPGLTTGVDGPRLREPVSLPRPAPAWDDALLSGPAVWVSSRGYVDRAAGVRSGPAWARAMPR